MPSNTTPTFPFSAIVGHDEVRLALLLAAIDPKIGGVLIEGPRGTAKSTLARGIADVLESPQNFVNLPLGATEDRLVGTLNIEQILKEGTLQFSPGLLHKAHGGVLYVDEINLLPDHLVDLLLDVAASGVNYVERDNISHQHPARILFIGTMNPDEGGLRPQLLDRFGFCVAINEQYSPELRREIIQRRLAFDDNPVAYCSQYTQEHAIIREKLQHVRRALAAVDIRESDLNYITCLCHEARVEGVRADLALLRAARALAALNGQNHISEQDMLQVAPWVLRHRSNPPSAQAAPNPPPPISPRETHNPAATSPPNTPQGNFGSMPPTNDAQSLPPQVLAGGSASVAGGTTPRMEEVEQRKERLPRTPGATMETGSIRQLDLRLKKN